MTATTTAAPRLSDEQAAELLALTRNCDSVELKVTVAEEQQRSTAIALGMDPLEAQLRLVAFFDTPDLALDRHGLVVRARRIQGKGDDSIVKLRPVVPNDLPAKLRRSENFRVEVDALPRGFVCSGTMKATLGTNDVRATVAGERRVRKLFTKEQRELFAAHAPEGITLDDLSILGPLLVLKLRFAPPELGRRLVAEMWLYPDGSRILELSTRCAPDEAFQVAAETRVFLAGRGVDLTADQQTKTRRALAYFAGTEDAGASWRSSPGGSGGPSATTPPRAADAFAGIAPQRTEESFDLYVLSRRSDASVKVRADLLDVKRLLAVGADGLEQWVPVMKAPFPLAAADVAAMLDALGTPAPDLALPAYGLDDLLAELVRPRADLRAVAIGKRRVHYAAGGCLAELSEMWAGEDVTRTVAVESEDPERVRAAVRELGLAGRPVACVARGLKALVGFDAHRFAVIDVGTNSVKLNVGERRADGTWRTLADRAEITRLGEGLDGTGRLGAAAMERTVAAIAGMAAEARRDGAEAIAAVGTAALRIAPNAAELVAAAQARGGVRVEVIPGAEETRLAYLAARAGLPAVAGAVVVFDTGGGSSQFTFGRGERVDERFSVDVGAARFTERYGLDGPVSDDALGAALAAIARDLAALGGRPAPDAVVGMGGAVTNLAAVRHGLAAYDPEVVQGTILDRAEIDRQIELYRTCDSARRREIVGLQPNRAEVILAGACIVRTVLELLGAGALAVSDRGLRHGVLAERFAMPPPAVAAAVTPLATTAAPGG